MKTHKHVQAKPIRTSEHRDDLPDAKLRPQLSRIEIVSARCLSTWTRSKGLTTANDVHRVQPHNLEVVERN